MRTAAALSGRNLFAKSAAVDGHAVDLLAAQDDPQFALPGVERVGDERGEAF